MSRSIPKRDITADQVVSRCSRAIAILHLCDSAAWAIQNGSGPTNLLADSVGTAMRLAVDLLEPVQEALEFHQGKKGGDA